MISLRWDKQAEKRLFNNIDNFMKDLQHGADIGVLEAAAHLRTATNVKYTPVDTNELVDSSFVATVKANSPTAEVAYVTPYAISVHEDMQKNHGRAYNLRYAPAKPKKDTEQAKFLERGLFEERFNMFNIIGDWITAK